MTEKNALQKAGLKVTTPRMRILALLESSQHQRHWRAEDIYQALSSAGVDVGLATVYRVLTQFETAGLIKRHRFDEGHSWYELDRGEHHDHLVCVRCNRVEEFVDPVIEQRQQAIAQKMGYQITDHSLYIYGVAELDSQGVCTRCHKRVDN